MAVPSYTTDLQTINLAEAITGWAEPDPWLAGGAAVQDDDNPFQGSYAVSKTFNAAGLGGLWVDYGSGITIPTDGAFLGWFYWAAPGSLESDANGGIRFLCGSSLGNFYAWIVGGTTSYIYGGWVNFAINPNDVAADYTIGTPTGVDQFFGAAVNNINSIFKGNPFLCDAFRYGRCEVRINGGEAANYATFAGFATQNDLVANRWGLIQAIAGGFLWKGLITLGYTSAVDFRDANTMVLVQNTSKVTANFNKIEIRQATSRVDWTNISFLALGTVSRGRFEMIDNADVNLDSCQFTDMDTFIFLSNASAIKCQWLRCNTITGPGILLTDSKILTPTVAADTSALVWNANVDLDGKIDRMTFSKGTNAHHAVTLGVNSPTTLTIRGVAFSGFNVANQENDSVLLLADKGSDQTWTIGCVGCSGTVSYKKVRAGDTVNITQGVAITVHVQNIDTSASIEGARVLVKAAAGGPKPYQVSVGLTRVGTTVTVAHTAHGLSTNDWVVIEGANEGEYNGVWQITYVNADSYTYQVSTTPSSPATGSPTSTFAAIHTVTNAQGNVSDTRVYASDQPFTGMVRKGTGTPPYKSMPISGTIDSEVGVSVTVGLIPE